MPTMTTLSTDGRKTHNSNLGKLIRFIIVITIMVVSLYFALNGVDWSQFWDVLQSTQWQYMLAMALLISLSFFVRGIRWWILLRTQIKLSVMDAFWGVCISYLGNSYLPARSGEILRSFWIGSRNEKTTAFVFSTVIIERVVDALILIAIFFAFVQFLPYWSEFRSSLQSLTVVSVAALLIFIFLPRFEQTVLTWLEKYDRLKHFAQQVFSALHTLHINHNIWWFGILSVVIILIEWLGMHFIAVALGMPGTWSILFLMSALGLSSALPSTPGALGIFQFVAVLVLVPLGITQETALAYIFLFQVTMYLLATIWGLLGIIYLKYGRAPDS